jgi:hypothetical protein
MTPECLWVSILSVAFAITLVDAVADARVDGLCLSSLYCLLVARIWLVGRSAAQLG